MPFVFNCNKCGGELQFKSSQKGTTTKCWQCGTVNTIPDNAVKEDETAQRITEGVKSSAMETRYGVLRSLSRAYKILAYVAGIGGTCFVVIGGIVVSRMLASSAMLSQFNVLNWITIVGYILSLAVGCITLLAASEAIKMFIDIEENTRASAYALKNIELSLKR